MVDIVEEGAVAVVHPEGDQLVLEDAVEEEVGVVAVEAMAAAEVEEEEEAAKITRPVPSLGPWVAWTWASSASS